MEDSNFSERFECRKDLHQYWYSQKTIDFLVSECQHNPEWKVGFLSTPSVFFSLTNPITMQNAVCFEYDPKFDQKDGRFVLYDFNHPENIPKAYHGSFDLLVIDPPYITREVWLKYAEAITMLLKKDAKLIISTLDDNAEMIKELTGCKKRVFRPYISTLIYQFAFYTNYESDGWGRENEEIPKVDAEAEEKRVLKILGLDFD
ncbi:hypothetical protein FGO68_gene17704 [Halteria grandinella]|uniref:Uncharacterized protein n=1 Tax=Halteria grandinella TaxID=5974 RepID=A0A8J8NIV0_HALGN|nr:hypothetical protein FGO68_gene17704 [Halteria grandinella]